MTIENVVEIRNFFKTEMVNFKVLSLRIADLTDFFSLLMGLGGQPLVLGLAVDTYV